MGQSYKGEMVPQRSQSNRVWAQRMEKGMGRGLACSPSRVSAPLFCLPSSQARPSRACAGGAGAPGPPAAARQLGVPLLLAQRAFLPAPLPGALPAGLSRLLVNGESRGCRGVCVGGVSNARDLVLAQGSYLSFPECAPCIWGGWWRGAVGSAQTPV